MEEGAKGCERCWGCPQLLGKDQLGTSCLPHIHICPHSKSPLPDFSLDDCCSGELGVVGPLSSPAISFCLQHLCEHGGPQVSSGETGRRQLALAFCHLGTFISVFGLLSRPPWALWPPKLPQQGGPLYLSARVELAPLTSRGLWSSPHFSPPPLLQLSEPRKALGQALCLDVT
jgi:hypothetical protein